MLRMTTGRFIASTMIWLAVCQPSILADPLHFPVDRPVDIKHMKFDLRIDIPDKSASGTATIDLTALRDINAVRFDAVDFRVAGVTVSRGEHSDQPNEPGAAVDFVNDGDSITIRFPDEPLKQGEAARITITYAVKNPSAGLNFFGPTEKEPDIPYVVWSQGESITNRYWIPCLDHPNEKQTTEMVITTADQNEVISNGKLLSKKLNNDGTVTFHWQQDLPHSAYLISIIVGEFHREEETWRGKPITYYVPEKYKDGVQRSFGNTVRMLEYFSNLIGVEYPWAQYAQTCAYGFGGGMENTSATTLGTRTLHDERAHLDFSSDSLVSHELGHQWFGDLVTCKDWAHLWLNEGFASFMTPIWFEHDLGVEEYDLAIYNSMKRALRGGKKRPIVDRAYKHPRDMFDARAYPKGASVLHMLRRRLGDDAFWRSIKRYLTEHAYQPVETSDLRLAMEAETGLALERFFYDWTRRPGAPKLKVSFSWDEETKLAALTVKQTQDAAAFHFPFEVEFHFENDPPLTISRNVTQKKHRFVLPLASYPTMVLIDPREAVLKKLKEKKGQDLWKNQLLKAPYAISRIRAAHQLAKRGSDADIDLLAQSLSTESFWGVAADIAQALGEAGGDNARDALLSGLHHKHPKVRRACAAELGVFVHDDKVINVLRKLIKQGDPSYLVEAAAIHSFGKLKPNNETDFIKTLLSRDSHQETIRSAALSALGSLGDPSGLDLLLKWTQVGHPHRARSAALSALGTLAEEAALSDQQIKRIVDAAGEAIPGDNRRVQSSAISLLSSLGRQARPALAVLRRTKAHDPERRIQTAAKKAIEKIMADTPPQVQVVDLQEQLDALQANYTALKEKLDELNATMP